MSRDNKGQFIMGHKSGMTGKHHSEETKKKMSAIAKKKKFGSWLIGIKKPPITEETREKMRKSHLGQIPWNKGIGNYSNQERERHKREAGLWRISVYSRDNYTCQKCGQRGGRLHAHHIFNFATHIDLRFAIDNGITLCRDCHIEFHKQYKKYNNTKEQLNEFLNL